MNREVTSALALTAVITSAQLFSATASAQNNVNKYNFDQTVQNTINPFPDEPRSNASFYTYGTKAALGLFRNGNLGLAIRFPPIDTVKATDGAILEIADTPEGDLDPKLKDMLIQVNVRLDPSLVANGADDRAQGMNVIQKGHFGEDQWKVQIDRKGNGDQVLSCRFAPAGAGVNGPREAKAKLVVSGPNAVINLFNGHWRGIQCLRKADMVTLVVGQQRDTQSAEQSIGSLDSAAPVSIGGRQITNDNQGEQGQINDQFHGDMENLIITIGDNLDPI